jgi:hypothetical protein
MFRNGISNGHRWFDTHRRSNGITYNDLRREFKYAYSKRSNYLSMEHWRNYGKHYCKPEFNDNLFCYRSKREWLLGHRLRDCNSWQRFECNSNRISINSV